ncbi:aminopeptidase P family protein, partial [Streptomyces sp. NPDC127166]
MTDTHIPAESEKDAVAVVRENGEPESEAPIEQRKNGLYPGVSDELAENMKSGWADTELHGLE